ncbi:hypothetical protein AMJ57_00470 [Parcubacteria bacterium SG8_24]|nr:MAG: hypothetical protein AMJ57_00470 [Parcubacteria bacterium SG8_24]
MGALASTLHQLLVPSSYFHLAWFLISLTLLFSCSRAVRRGTEGCRTFASFMACFHALVALEAALLVAWGLKSREVFSENCIWFNLLLTLVYYRLRRQAATTETSSKTPS